MFVIVVESYFVVDVFGGFCMVGYGENILCYDEKIEFLGFVGSYEFVCVLFDLKYGWGVNSKEFDVGVRNYGWFIVIVDDYGGWWVVDGDLVCYGIFDIVCIVDNKGFSRYGELLLCVVWWLWVWCEWIDKMMECGWVSFVDKDDEVFCEFWINFIIKFL